MRQREARRTNMVTLQLRQLHVPPGQRLLIEDVTWADFEAIVDELGEHRGTRVAYKQHLDSLRRKDSLRGTETTEISVRLENYCASHFEGSAHGLCGDRVRVRPQGVNLSV